MQEDPKALLVRPKISRTSITSEQYNPLIHEFSWVNLKTKFRKFRDTEISGHPTIMAKIMAVP